jgi:hypothetical protein
VRKARTGLPGHVIGGKRAGGRIKRHLLGAVEDSKAASISALRGRRAAEWAGKRLDG